MLLQSSYFIIFLMAIDINLLREAKGGNPEVAGES